MVLYFEIRAQTHSLARRPNRQSKESIVNNIEMFEFISEAEFTGTRDKGQGTRDKGQGSIGGDKYTDTQILYTPIYLNLYLSFNSHQSYLPDILNILIGELGLIYFRSQQLQVIGNHN